MSLVEGFGAGEKNFTDAVLPAPVSPALGRCTRGGKQGRSVDKQHRLAVDSDVSRVAKKSADIHDERQVVFFGMVLRDQYVLVPAVPSTTPVFIRPADTERKIE